MYADDTSIIVTSPNLVNFETQIDKIFGDINNWFKINQLVLNYEGRTESHEQLFFAFKPGTEDEGEYGGRWNQLLCYP